MKLHRSFAVAALAACSDSGAETAAVAYPLATGIVTDKALGSMGDPVSIEHEGQELRFCCKPCIARFQAEPAKYLAKLDGQ
ncbi:MAG: hypothetical protein WD226_01085 [Planctomycetota bacterium]